MRVLALAGLLVVLGCAPDLPFGPADLADAIAAAADAVLTGATDAAGDGAAAGTDALAGGDGHADGADGNLDSDGAAIGVPKCGDGVCTTGETVGSCPADCMFCPTPGTSDGCGTATCFARSAAGGGNLCLPDIPWPSWPAPFPYLHPASDFSEHGDFVTDTLTGLSWGKESLGPLDWPTALLACMAAKYGGFSDWRLPTKYELLTLTDGAKPFFPSSSAPNLSWPNTGPNDHEYWSGMPWKTGGSAWYVYFDDGNGAYGALTDTYRVRCVR